VYPYGDSQPIKTLGEFKTTLRYKNESCVTTLLVIPSSGTSLLSWKTSTELRLLSLENKVTNAASNQLTEEYSDIFKGLGKLKDCKVKLHIDTSVTPVAQTHRRVPFHMRKDLEQQIAADGKLGVIEKPTGATPWVSPVVCVPKKSGKVRVCVDMRCVNKAIKREHHNTPTIHDLVHDLNGAAIFSKLDLNQGYNQLELEEESRYVTTFATHVGLRQFKRLNFGICSASEVFQEAISHALSGLQGVINFSDDILVYGKNQQSHDENLQKTFQRLREKGLTLSKEKCEFNKTSLTFRHVFSAGGISPDPTKIHAITEMKAPKTSSEVRSLLGMTNYCGSRFVHDYATLTHDLRELTKKDAEFNWTEKHEAALKELKKALVQSPALQYFDPSLKTEIHVDASPVGLCAILMQMNSSGERHTVQYASRALTPVEQRYSQTEREALAVVWACEHLHIFIMGNTFTVFTDHKALVPLFQNPKSKPKARIERWALRLQPYEFNIEYRTGQDNPADYLSRHTPDKTSRATSDRRLHQLRSSDSNTESDDSRRNRRKHRERSNTPSSPKCNHQQQLAHCKKTTSHQQSSI
jgi:hypothetical protein